MKKALFCLALALMACTPFQGEVLNGNFVVFPLRKSSSLSKDSTLSFAHLSRKDLDTIDQVLNKEVEAYNAEHPDERDKIELPLYRFQIVPMHQESGVKTAWINAFCDESVYDWKTELVEVMDGGPCFFEATLDLDSGELEWFGAHGSF